MNLLFQLMFQTTLRLNSLYIQSLSNQKEHLAQKKKTKNKAIKTAQKKVS
jgi:hypothetical protein